MKTSCERPYQTMISTAGTLRRHSETASDWHIRRLATELAHAVADLDARMRAGLNPPYAWKIAHNRREPGR